MTLADITLGVFMLCNSVEAYPASPPPNRNTVQKIVAWIISVLAARVLRQQIIELRDQQCGRQIVHLPNLQSSRDGCTHLVALLADALRTRLGFENVAYRCTRSHPMQGPHLLLIAGCPGAALFVRTSSTRLSRANRDPEKSGQTRQTTKISGYGSVWARPLKCRA